MKAKVLSLFFVAILVLAPIISVAGVSLYPNPKDTSKKVLLSGFSQLEMRGGDGNSAEGGVLFKAQRLRLGAIYVHQPWFGKLLVDFNQSAAATDGGLPKTIKDALVGYRFSDAAFFRMGMMKSPVGMDFTTSGWDLDIVERNKMEKGLVLERAFGVMISGRQIFGNEPDPKRIRGTEVGHEKQSGTGLGYDLAFFNPAGRSSAVTWDSSQLGDANAYAARVHYDHGWPLHVEASYGTSQEAGGVGTEDYEVYDFGLDSSLRNRTLTLKAEYISGSSIKGESGWDQNCFIGTAGLLLSPRVEAMVKHYAASASRTGVDTDLGNTYIGLNLFVAPTGSSPTKRQAQRIQVNYVMVSGDDRDAATTFNGLAGMTANGWTMQWQWKF